MALPPNIQNLSNRPHGEINNALMNSLTMAEIDHILHVYGEPNPYSPVTMAIATIIYVLPVGVLIGWFIWG